MQDIENSHPEIEHFDSPESADPGAQPEDQLPQENFADETPDEQASAAEAPPDEPIGDEAPLEPETKQWYIIHPYSGFERKGAESLRTRAEAFGFAGQIGQILIPEEEVVELRNGKK